MNHSHETDRAICAVISRSGVKAKEIAAKLGLERKTVNRILYGSPLMKELCWQDADGRWHGIVRQVRPHSGRMEFSGCYSLVRDFLDLSEEAWLEKLTEGCANIGRNLNDTRGLFHSFRDCRMQMIALFRELADMAGDRIFDWEIAFELRLSCSTPSMNIWDFCVDDEPLYHDLICRGTGSGRTRCWMGSIRNPSAPLFPRRNDPEQENRGGGSERVRLLFHRPGRKTS